MIRSRAYELGDLRPMLGLVSELWPIGRSVETLHAHGSAHDPEAPWIRWNSRAVARLVFSRQVTVPATPSG